MSALGSFEAAGASSTVPWGRWIGSRAPGRRGRLAAVLLGLLTLFFASFALAAPTFPPLTGRVVDDAHVLSPEAQADLTQKLAALETQTTRQLVVVTLPSLQGYDIADYGYQLGRAWKIGQKGQDNGVLFIVAPSEHKVRVEVGYGLEPVLTDALSSLILQQRVLPKFRSGDVQGGVVDGTDALIGQLSLPTDQAKAKVAEAEQAPAAPGRQSLVGMIFAGLILFWVLSSFVGALGGRRAGFSAWWLLPLIFSSGGRRDWGGGFGGGGFGGGGGFSGGGGSFGGGGASGSW